MCETDVCVVCENIVESGNISPPPSSPIWSKEAQNPVKKSTFRSKNEIVISQIFLSNTFNEEKVKKWYFLKGGHFLYFCKQ